MYAKQKGPGKAILAAFIVAILMKCFLFDFMITEGHSMMPAIKSGSIIIVLPAAYGLHLPWSNTYLCHWAKPKVGDVVVFITPLGERAVKRCGALESGGRFMALGDNKSDSFDSRSYGPVPLDQIIGKVVGVK
jgi:signal peptidase I